MNTTDVATLATDGPFKLTMDVFFKVVGGEHAGMDAWVTINLTPGNVPTDEYIQNRIAAAMEELGDNLQLASRHEFVNELFAEEVGVGVNFSFPGPDTFRLVEEY